ncbi:MAG: hypothetical protein ACI8QF_002856 [Limisphaerales bacterium]
MGAEIEDKLFESAGAQSGAQFPVEGFGAKRIPIDAMTPFTDVFQSEFTLAGKVCILAPGPSGAPFYSAIPDDYQVIAIAKSVLAPAVVADVWLMNHNRQDWFEEADRTFDGICVFGESAAVPNPLRHPKAARYFYRTPKEQLSAEQLLPVDGCIRHGATTSACAVQLAYNFGVRDILLCGVDMSGDGYWDGDSNPQPNHGNVWPAVARLNPLIHWLTSVKGLRIHSLSPTRLDVPIIQGK